MQQQFQGFVGGEPAVLQVLHLEGVSHHLQDAIERLGRPAVEAKYGNLFDMYARITGEDPYSEPMRIYPAVHYVMGGLWVDYDLQTNITGLFCAGEARPENRIRPGSTTDSDGVPQVTIDFTTPPAAREQMASMREGGWQVGLGRDLRGTRLGLLGMGRLGTEMAKFGTAFGMDVVGWSQNLTPAAAEAAGARYVEKAELFETSNFVSVHLRLSDRTQGIVGRDDIARMKPDACLINTSRGGLVDNDALVAALREGRLGGAALDVYDHEPLPADDPLRSVPGLLLTPHIGYVTRESYEVFYPETVEAIRAWLDGTPVRVLA